MSCHHGTAWFIRLKYLVSAMAGIAELWPPARLHPAITVGQKTNTTTIGKYCPRALLVRGVATEWVEDLNTYAD